MNKRKSLAILLAFMMCLTCVTPAFAAQKDSNLFASIDSVKENVVFIQTDISKEIIYTYDQAGVSYKVVENVSPDLSKVNSEIYKKDETGNYTLASTMQTTIIKGSDGILNVQISENGRIKMAESFAIASEATDDSHLLKKAAPLASPTYEWRYEGLFHGSNRIAKYTLGAVVALILSVTGILTHTSPATAAANAIAQMVIRDSIPTLWWSTHLWCYYVYNTMFWEHIGCETNTRYWSNSARTNYLGYVVDTDV